MPFKETCPVEERIGLFRDYESGQRAPNHLSYAPQSVSPAYRAIREALPKREIFSWRFTVGSRKTSIRQT